jgi:hypothetical protein
MSGESKESKSFYDKFVEFITSPGAGIILLSLLYSIGQSTVTELYALGGVKGVAYVASFLGNFSLALVAGTAMYIGFQITKNLLSFCYNKSMQLLGYTDKPVYDKELSHKLAEVKDLKAEISAKVSKTNLDMLSKLLQEAPERQFDDYGYKVDGAQIDKLDVAQREVVILSKMKRGDDYKDDCIELQSDLRKNKTIPSKA